MIETNRIFVENHAHLHVCFISNVNYWQDQFQPEKWSIAIRILLQTFVLLTGNVELVQWCARYASTPTLLLQLEEAMVCWFFKSILIVFISPSPVRPDQITQFNCDERRRKPVWAIIQRISVFVLGRKGAKFTTCVCVRVCFMPLSFEYCLNYARNHNCC